MRVFCYSAVLAGLLVGCGNTGDLYLPKATIEKPKKIPRIVAPAATVDTTPAKDDESEMESQP